MKCWWWVPCVVHFKLVHLGWGSVNGDMVNPVEGRVQHDLTELGFIVDDLTEVFFVDCGWRKILELMTDASLDNWSQRCRLELLEP